MSLSFTQIVLGYVIDELVCRMYAVYSGFRVWTEEAWRKMMGFRQQLGWF